MPSHGGKLCEVLEKEEIAACNTQPCDVEDACIDGKWAEWNDWEVCSKTCDGGFTFRTRKFAAEPNYCGKPATGVSTEEHSCNHGVPCSVDKDCEFGEWSMWNHCTDPCSGVKERTRRIAVQGAGQNGKFCEGALQQTAPCVDGNNPICKGRTAIDCVLSEWEFWSTCSISCGHGQHGRVRTITRLPEHGGRGCSGALRETKPCHIECAVKSHVPVDCLWGEWDMWSACDKCGGQRKRFRHIMSHPKNGGSRCEAGAAEEIGNCTRNCGDQVFCAWSEWGNWSRCSATCGTNALKRRNRVLQSHSVRSVPPERLYAEGVADEASLHAKVQQVQTQRFQELLLAFMCGAVSLVAFFGVSRKFSYMRGACSSGPIASRTISTSPTSE